MGDEKDGIFGSDGFEKVHHESFLSGPGVDEKEINLAGVKPVVDRRGVDWDPTRACGFGREEIFASDAFAFLVAFGEVAGI